MVRLVHLALHLLSHLIPPIHAPTALPMLTALVSQKYAQNPAIGIQALSLQTSWPVVTMISLDVPMIMAVDHAQQVILDLFVKHAISKILLSRPDISNAVNVKTLLKA